ncbi:hypothetical protein N7462_004067 [Penicillium macrosclerotiorum]|uniref:uncharacterized protein n=1 Tax=Penicillium macrosclerotiorum TaxID=303699 RepID=UPI002547BC49|nr:uncharacterized protein N7462_004067 [Penicillium macrosclerotiorum]KAJ5689675.1 hypothetical protein N7462_004067 [Penicillium macrosclerotiorum]
MPLKVIVVGAGLGGLGAAIALNRSGHDVHVIEQSSFLNEVGAAINVAPNATRILQDWGCDFEMLQPVRGTHFNFWDAEGNFIQSADIDMLRNTLDAREDFYFAHRVDLHNALQAMASRPVDGRKVHLRLSSRVASVNAETGVVTLEDGTRYTGDLIIGADGIHSRTVKSITGEEPRKEDTGQNCFRFLVPATKMQSNPLTASLLEKVGTKTLNCFMLADRRLVVYPCRHGNLFNCAVIYPSGLENEARNSSWLDSASKDQLLQTLEGFCPEVQEIGRLAEDVKLWTLGCRQPPRTFVKGKLALVGDAAHPTLPHQGQGGCQAFEDAAALGALFPADTSVEQVSHRLELYDRVRYAHSVTVMILSKKPNERRAELLDELRTYVPDAEVPDDMFAYAWLSYPKQEAQRLLAATSVKA